MNERMRVWGKNIKVRREALRLSQSEFALQVGVRQATVSRWEAGLMAPRDDQREVIANVLSRDVFELFPAFSKAKTS